MFRSFLVGDFRLIRLAGPVSATISHYSDTKSAAIMTQSTICSVQPVMPIEVPAQVHVSLHQLYDLETPQKT